jgi:hypothetical protein
MKDMGRWGERHRDWVRLDDLDGGPRVVGADVGFYAIWSRSRRRLLVNVTPTARRAERPQVALRPEQAAQLRDFLLTSSAADTPEAVLVLDDADGPATGAQLRLAWLPRGTRLVVTINSPTHDEPIGAIDLRPEQLQKLQRFLTSTVPKSGYRD